MRLPLSWLKDFVDVKVSTEKLAELLTLSGSEVEKIHRPVKLDRVIVGEVLSMQKHPNADKLQLVTVRVAEGSSDIRSEQTMLSIVCGAFNMKVGDKVPVALVGAVLPGGVTIARREVRGVVSDGMLCGAEEIGVESPAVGKMIHILPKDAVVGSAVADVLGGADTVFDLDITPNRGDCLSIRGLAREVAALTGRGMKNKELRIKGTKPRFQILPPQRDPALAVANPKFSLAARVEDKKACPLYYARLIEGVSVGEAPLVMRQRLAAVGIRSINAAVDIANYVMMEIGQPLHVFDAAKIATKTESRIQNLEFRGERRIELVVRRAKRGESLKLLDGKTYELHSDDLVIAAGKRVDDVAGVMGGEESGTTHETKAIVLEAAIFDPVTIRRTWKRHGIRTEAAIRFEKRVDPGAVEAALDRATALLLQYVGGTVVKTVKVGSAPKAAKPILVSPEVIAATIGTNISAAKQKQIFTALGFRVLNSSARGGSAFGGKFQPPNSSLTITAPSWRHDIEGPHDLVEEVGRLLPYNDLVPTQLVARVAPPAQSSVLLSTREARLAFLRYGFDELVLYSFYGVSAIERSNLKLADHMRVDNPLSANQEYLRSSLLPQLLDAAARNAGMGIEPKVFEVGTVFSKGSDGSVHESLHVAAVAPATTEYLRDLKAVGTALGVKLWDIQVLGKDEAARFKLRMPVAVVEADCSTLSQEKRTQFVSLALYPPVLRDLAVVVPYKTAFSRVASCIRATGDLAVDFELFDIYEGKGVPEGMKSFALHLRYSSAARTLTSADIDQAHTAIIAHLERDLGARVRE